MLTNNNHNTQTHQAHNNYTDHINQVYAKTHSQYPKSNILQLIQKTKKYPVCLQILVLWLTLLLAAAALYQVTKTISQQTTPSYPQTKFNQNIEIQHQRYPSKSHFSSMSHQQDAIDDAVDGVRSGVSRVADKVGDTASGLWRGAKNIGRGAVQTTGDAASSAWQGVKDVGRTVTGSSRYDDRSHQGIFGAVRGAGRGVYSGVSRVGRGTRRVASGLWRGTERVTRSILG